MRFKAKLVAEQLHALYQCIVPIAKIASSSSAESSISWMKNGGIVALDDTVLRLSCKGKSMDVDGISCFAELRASDGEGIFYEYRIESAAANNQIVMEMDLHQLKAALQSILPSDRAASTTSSGAFDASQQMLHLTTVIKLAKRNNIPCLCIESLGSIQIHHAIPCRVLPAQDLALYLPPRIPTPQVQLEIPHSIPLKAIVDRLVHISNRVRLQGHGDKGELLLHVDTDGASNKTLVQGLKPHGDPSSNSTDDENESQAHRQMTTMCLVDTKKLSACLSNAKGLFPSQLLCLVENEAVVLHSSSSHNNLGFCTYYVPVHFLSAEDMQVETQ